jgi:hypothetical protein
MRNTTARQSGVNHHFRDASFARRSLAAFQLFRPPRLRKRYIGLIAEGVHNPTLNEPVSRATFNSGD